MSETTPRQEKNPKQRRYRIPRSCDKCRVSKVKCVVENDRCSACTRLGIACTFVNPGSLKERPPTIKDAEQLMARIRSLERLLHAVDPALDLNNLPDPDAYQFVSRSRESPKLPTPLVTASVPLTESYGAQTNLPDSLQSQLSTVLTGIHGIGIPSKRDALHTHWTGQPMSKFVGINTAPDQYIGPNSLLSVADPVAFGIPNMPSWHLGTLYPIDEFLRLRHEEYVSSVECFYPEPDLEQDLIQIYFQHFHPLVPIIHPSTFHCLHKAGYVKTNPAFRTLCLTMFSIASRWSTDPRVQLDLTGTIQPSRQFAGMTFGYAAYIGLVLPGGDRASLFHLQAYVLLAIGSLATCQNSVTWLIAEQGLICAIECGAHRQVHHIWNSDPLQDYLRRQAFFQLYEIAHGTSNSLYRSPLLEHDDFDLQPTHVPSGDPLGIFVNPYSSISPAVHGACVAFDEVRVLMSQLGTLRSMLPLLLKMKAMTKTPGGAGSIKSLKALVDQLDFNASKWFDKVPLIFKRPDVEGTAEMLMFSVRVIACYHKFQLLIHQTLFHYEAENPDSKTASTNPHIDRCVEFAIPSIQAINKLRLRKLLTDGFYWVPGEIIISVVLLACSIRKQRKLLSPQENKVRRDNILLAITILDELESIVHTAAVYSKMSKIMFNLLDEENVSVLDSLQIPLDYQQSGNQGCNPPPPMDTTSALTGVMRETSWDPLEISQVTIDSAVDATGLNLPFPTTLPACPPGRHALSHLAIPHPNQTQLD